MPRRGLRRAVRRHSLRPRPVAAAPERAPEATPDSAEATSENPPGAAREVATELEAAFHRAAAEPAPVTEPVTAPAAVTEPASASESEPAPVIEAVTAPVIESAAVTACEPVTAPEAVTDSESDPVTVSGIAPARDRLRTAGHDAVAEAFFASAPAPEPSGDWDDIRPPPMDPTARRAMWATIALLVVGVLGLTGYRVYHRVLMPAPAELGSAPAAADHGTL